MTEKEDKRTLYPEGLDLLTKQDKKVINSFIRDSGNLIILWLLNQKRLYGNAIINRVNRFYPNKDKKITGSSRIYPNLYRLEDQGLIEGSWENRGRQQIKYYEITDKGREELSRVKKIVKYVLNCELKDFMTDMVCR